MDPNSSEATQQQLDLAREQGEAYGRALACMIGEVARDGGQQEAGHYRIGYAIEEAEGMYEWTDGELVWRDTEGENAHVEEAVRDAADGRFVPDVRVFAMLVDTDGNEVVNHEQTLPWHPMIYHYCRNRIVPQDGEYALSVRVEPPASMRDNE